MSKNKKTGIILAGGQSHRMGSNKALIHYKSKRLIDISIAIISPLVTDILVSSNDFIPDIDFKIIPDSIKNIGPMGGLFTCLSASASSVNLIIPCDVPLVSTAYYNSMLDKIGNYDAVIPRHSNGKLEPLIGVYQKSLLPMMEEQINQQNYKLVDLLERLNVYYINIPEFEDFKNMNYPNDLL